MNIHLSLKCVFEKSVVFLGLHWNYLHIDFCSCSQVSILTYFHREWGDFRRFI